MGKKKYLILILISGTVPVINRSASLCSCMPQGHDFPRKICLVEDF